MIVIDSSCVVELVIAGSRASSVRERLELDRDLVAPHILDAEVISVLSRLESAGQIDRTAASLAVLALEDLPVERFGQVALLDRVWELRPRLTAGAATYVALAEALDARLITLDHRLALTEEIRCIVEPIHQ